MLRPRFFTETALREGETLRLEKEPSRHIARSLRMRTGDPLCLFDGSGREAHGVVRALERSTVEVTIERIVDVDRESPLSVVLAISVSRGDRMDTVVQKATELGVTEIWPLVSERTEVRLDTARMAKKRDHWQRVAISACEQCGRNRVPNVAPCAPFRDVLAREHDPETLRLLLHPGRSAAPRPHQCASLMLLVGPEGGFSESEVGAAHEAGFQPMELGPRILRTETAPLVALTLAQGQWGDLPRWTSNIGEHLR